MAKTTAKSDSEKGWAIRVAGSSRAAGSYRTQKAAIKAAEALSRKSKANVVIYEHRPAKRHNTSLVIGADEVNGRSQPRTGRALKRNLPTVGQLTRVRSDVLPRGKDLAKRNSRFAVNRSHSALTKAHEWTKWVESHTQTLPTLSDGAISRESIYRDRG